MEEIGFIGLGIMPNPMALHILKAGDKLSVLKRNNLPAELIEAVQKFSQHLLLYYGHMVLCYC